MSFIEEFEQEWENDFGKPKPNPHAEIIKKTLDMAEVLLDQDYLPLLQQKLHYHRQYLKDLKHLNLYKLGWRVQFGSSKQWAGLCSYDPNMLIDTKSKSKKKNIYLSADFVKHDENWSQNMESTMLHEMTHAMVNEIFMTSVAKRMILHEIDPQHKLTEGHGVVWAMICSALTTPTNAEHPKFCAIYYQNAKYKESFKLYKATCLFCGTVQYGNEKDFTDTCTKCFKPVFVESNNE